MATTMSIEKVRPKPQAYLRVGYACNSRCTFCCAQGGWSLPMRELGTIKREIDKMVGEMDLQSISISGGEPTVHPEILEIIRYCRRKGFRNIHLNSNARRFKTAEIVQEYLDAGMNSVMVSIQGHDKETHDGLHRVKGAFDQMVTGVKNIQDTGIFYRFFTVICQANVNHLPEIAQFCHDTFHGFHSMIFCYPVIKDLEGFDKDSVLCRYSEVQPMIRATIETGHDLGVCVLAQLIPPCLLGEHYYLATEFRRPDFFASEPTFTELMSFHEDDRLLLPACVNCEARHCCPGIQYDYVSHFADPEAELFTPLDNVDYGQVPFNGHCEQGFPL